MYPETDVAPVGVQAVMLKRLKDQLPAPAPQQARELENLGLNLQTSMQVVEQGLKGKFLQMLAESKADAPDVAAVLLQERTALSRQGIPIAQLTDDRMVACLRLLAAHKISRSALSTTLALAAQNPDSQISILVKQNNLEAYTPGELAAIVKAYAGMDPKTAFETIMRSHRLRVHAKELSKLLGVKA